MDYLVPPSDAAATQARRKIEANYLRYRCEWLQSKGYSKAFKDKTTGLMITPDGKTDDQLIDDYAPQMLGERAGALNSVDGFTTSWSGDVRRRLTDNAIVIPLPDDLDLRTIIMAGVPAPHSIEQDSADWWPQVEM